MKVSFKSKLEDASREYIKFNIKICATQLCTNFALVINEQAQAQLSSIYISQTKKGVLSPLRIETKFNQTQSAQKLEKGPKKISFCFGTTLKLIMMMMIRSSEKFHIDF